MIRLIFEFDTEQDAKNILACLDENIVSENLTTTGMWSWGAESITDLNEEFSDEAT